MAEPSTLSRSTAAAPNPPTVEGKDLHQRLLDRAPVLIWRSDTDGRCTWFNHTWLRFTGRTLEQEFGEGWAEGVHPDDLQDCLKIYLEAFADRRAFEMEYRLRRHDGEYRWISDAGIPFEGSDGAFGGYIGYCFDVTERRRSEETHRLMAERWDFAMHSADIGIYEADAVRGQQFLSAGVQRMLGMAPGEWSGALQDWTARLHPEDAQAFERQEGGVEVREYRIRHGDGTWRWVEDRGRVLQADPTGRPLRCVGSLIDVTDRKLMEQELERLARTDELTGLVNRRELLRGFGELTRMSPHHPLTLAVMFCDLDGFKQINDSLGHAVGDEVLRLVSGRVRGSLRHGDQAGRFGGDEMVLVLQGVRDLATATAIARKISLRIAEPIPTSAGPMNVTASIGITLARPGESVEELIGRADAAMYQAKREQAAGGIVAIAAPAA